MALEADGYRRRGDTVAAGALARVALERRLRDLCKAHGVPIKAPGNAASCLFALRQRRKVDRQSYKRLKPILKLANRAAHGQELDPIEAAEVVFGVGDFLSTHGE